MIQFPSGQLSERRRRRRQARRDEIVDAAMLLVQEHGIESLTLQALAERLDLAVGTLYRYVRSKDELISALQREVLDVLDANTRQCRERCTAAFPGPDPDSERRRIRALLPLVAIGELYRAFSQEAPPCSACWRSRSVIPGACSRTARPPGPSRARAPSSRRWAPTWTPRRPQERCTPGRRRSAPWPSGAPCTACSSCAR